VLTYIVYDKRSGDILHTHVQASLGTEPDRLSRDQMIRLARELAGRAATVPAAELDVIEVDRDVLRTLPPPGNRFSVDLKSGRLAIRPVRSERKPPRSRSRK